MPNQETISIRYKLNADDYASFNRYHGRWQMALLFLFYWVVFVVIAAMRGGSDGGRLAVLIPAGLLLSGVLIGLQLWSIKVKTRRLFQNDKLAQMEQQLQLSDAGIRHNTVESVNDVAWANVYKAADTRTALIVYLARNRAVVVPKRDIGADWNQVKDMLRGNLPSGKLSLRS